MNLDSYISIRYNSYRLPLVYTKKRGFMNKLTLYNVKSEDMPRLMQSIFTIAEIGHTYPFIEVFGSGKDRKGKEIFLIPGTHQLMEGKTTKRKQFFKVLTNNQIIVVQPDNDVFESISVYYLEKEQDNA